VNLPIYRQFDMTWLAHWPLFLKMAGWGSLALEGFYWILIWPRRTRPFWIAGIVSMHLGISIFLGLQLFGLIMCVLTLSLFAVSAEPGTLLAGRKRELDDGAPGRIVIGPKLATMQGYDALHDHGA
jgi:hypothetical protein